MGDHVGGPKQAALYFMICLISSGQSTDCLLFAFAEHDREDSIVHLDITEILENYLDIFVEPTVLSPPRLDDH